ARSASRRPPSTPPSASSSCACSPSSPPDTPRSPPVTDRVGPPRCVLLGAFGDPGHAFPMIALGRALRARGHDVTLQTWRRWREPVEAEGITFAAAPEYDVFPSGPEPLDFYE